MRQKEKRHQRIRWLDSLIDEMNMNLGKLWEMVRDRKAWRAAVHGVTKSSHDWATEQQQRASQVALVVKNPPAKAEDIRDLGLTPGLGRSPGGGHGNPLQYCCLENPMDRAA